MKKIIVEKKIKRRDIFIVLLIMLIIPWGTLNIVNIIQREKMIHQSRLFYKKNDYKAAEKNLNKTLQKFTLTKKILKLKLFITLHNYMNTPIPLIEKELLWLCSRAVHDTSFIPLASFIEALIFKNAGKDYYDSGAEKLITAIETDPGVPPELKKKAYSTLDFFLNQSGKQKKRLQWINKNPFLIDDSRQKLMIQADIYLKLKSYNQADKIYKKLIFNKSWDKSVIPHAMKYIEMLKTLHLYKKMELVYLYIYEKEPSDPEIAADYGLFLLQNKNNRIAARRVWYKALRENPGHKRLVNYIKHY